MPFTDDELTQHLRVLEECFWSRRRPPVHLRDKVREGQRIQDRTIELFLVRPAFQRPGEWIEESIAKIQGMVHQGVWRIFWKRARGRWFRYQPCPEAPTLAEALREIDADPHGCFFG